MRLTRTFLDSPLAPGQSIRLDDNAATHLVRVLRLKPGDACILFNGDGHDYPARLLACDKRTATVEILGKEAVDNESPLAITLLQGIARGEKMDLILQKSTELGVAAFLPVHSQRSEVKLEGERAQKRHAHWQGVIAAACEQSGRARLPQVQPARPLAEALALPDLPGQRHYLSPLASAGIDTLDVAPADARMVIAVGPEGGWSERDLQQLDAAGFTPLRLGPRILRTETAGLAAIAALQMRLGDLR